MKVKKSVWVIIGCLIFLIGIVGFTPILLETNLTEIPKLLVHMRAKEFCSCHFSLGNKEKYCLEKTKYGYPDGSHHVDYQKKQVSFSFMGSVAIARMESENLGCRLVK
jgi:hypothetical protein